MNYGPTQICNTNRGTQAGLSRNERLRHIDCMEAAAHVRPVLQPSGAVSDNVATARTRTYDTTPTHLREAAGRPEMLHYAVVFFIIAIIAAVLGFGGLAAGAAGIAKVLFFVFLVLALITFLRRA
jgi:uncharacterized membrane protein YtjA (UPF0391 family)